MVLIATSLSAASHSPGVAIRSDRTTAPLRRDEWSENDRGRLETRRPYARGNVPVAFVHGLWGSPRNLGAESIDFLDIMFRLEREFRIKIERNEL
jgi:hypothetical protein